jgi:SAM-dependent methyltransferase
MSNKTNAYEGVENLNNFSKKSFVKYCKKKLISVNKHIKFLKKHSNKKNYQGKIFEIGSGNGKLLFRLEKEKLLTEGIGCELSKSRYRFSNKFKKKFGIKKVKIINKNFFDIKLKKNYFDFIIGTDVIINLIGGIKKENVISLIKKCEKALKPNGKLILEFMTFEKEKKQLKLNYDKKLLAWKKFKDEDPFIFGLDEMTLNKDKIFWKKYFIPRNLKKIEYFDHPMLVISKNFFSNRNFNIYKEWAKNDGTAIHEYIAVKKIKKK